MATQASPPPRIRFDSFELDATSGELRKSGTRLRLHHDHSASFSSSSKHLARSSLARRFASVYGKTQPSSTSSTESISRSTRFAGHYRQPAEHPRYVETLPRRGYRFIGTVELTQLPIKDNAPACLSPAVLSGGDPGTPVQSEASGSNGLLAPLDSYRVGRGPRRGNRWNVLLLFLLCRQHVLAGQGAIVLADFANTTGDPAFDGTLRRALTMQLKQSPFLTVLSDERIRRTLPLMGKAADAPVTSRVARGLCMRTGSTAVVAGSIASLGGHYVVGLDVVNCHSGDSLDEEQIEAARKEDVSKALGDAATRLRGKLGQSFSSVERFDSPSELTTASLEALQADDLGCRALDQGNYVGAIPLFQRAIQLDPKFVAAYNSLAAAYSDLGENGLAAENAQKG